MIVAFLIGVAAMLAFAILVTGLALVARFHVFAIAITLGALWRLIRGRR